MNSCSLDKLIRNLQTDAALIMSDVNRQYFSGFSSSAGTMLVTRKKTYFITDFRYIAAARATVVGCEVLLQDELYLQLNHIIRENDIKTLAVETKEVTLSQFENLKKKLNVTLVSTPFLSDTTEHLREIKSEYEINCIKKAQQITDETFDHICGFIKPGITENEISLEIFNQMKKLGAQSEAFSSIVASGKNGASPHFVCSDKPVCQGEMITMDFGAVFGGYCSDMTRTVALGKIDSTCKKVYDTVLQAQTLALENISAGKSCKEIDAIARDYIYKNGYQGCFGHSLGHSCGLVCHETPSLSPKCEDILKPNMVLTVEPGVYIDGICGVRIEDMVIIRDKSCENITKSKKELITL
ncbi:MAG: aminopeptidase P family protein [Oscillospiraceae bacterium]